jgi:uracil-DNA glycosylase family 4
MNLMEEKQQKLAKIAEEVKKCTRCDLYKRANEAVPGEGHPQAEVMFIGEGPGFWEDKQGRPFVGQAGKLLDRLLALINLPRKEIFIGNVVKHRPPENRDPLLEEIEACAPFLDEQIAIIDPRIIVTLGRFSLNKFFPGEYISRIHGQARVIDFAGKKRIVIPMYHPAAALRSSIIMEEVKKDFQKIENFRKEKNVS